MYVGPVRYDRDPDTQSTGAPAPLTRTAYAMILAIVLFVGLLLVTSRFAVTLDPTQRANLVSTGP